MLHGFHTRVFLQYIKHRAVRYHHTTSVRSSLDMVVRRALGTFPLLLATLLLRRTGETGMALGGACRPLPLLLTDIVVNISMVSMSVYLS